MLLILACAGACKCNRMPFPPRPATIKNKTVNVKYSQNILDLATFKTISNVKKTADATRDLIGNKKFKKTASKTKNSSAPKQTEEFDKN